MNESMWQWVDPRNWYIVIATIMKVSTATLVATMIIFLQNNNNNHALKITNESLPQLSKCVFTSVWVHVFGISNVNICAELILLINVHFST
jgi:hypothetical protein